MNQKLLPFFSIVLLFIIFPFSQALSQGSCSSALSISTGSCTSASFDGTSSYAPAGQSGCATGIGDAWFTWVPGGTNTVNYNMRFNVELTGGSGVVHMRLIYSESWEESSACFWSTGTEGYTRYQTLCNISLSGPGDVYEFESAGLDGSGVFFVQIEKVSGSATGVQVCPVQLGTCNAPINDRCATPTAMGLSNGVDSSTVTLPAWSNAMKASTSCATKQRMTALCSGSSFHTEDHYSHNSWLGCLQNGNVGDNPPGGFFGTISDQADQFLENTVYYSFQVPISATDWYLNIGSSSQCSQQPNNLVVMLMSSLDCNDAKNSVRMLYNKTTVWGSLPSADWSSGALSLNTGQTYYVVLDGTRASQCDVCILLTRATTNPVLPAILSQFRGQNEGRDHRLFWQTSSEQGHDYFLIERSENGEDFLPLDVISGTGNSDQGNQYEFVDAEAPIGTAYYRLNMVDENGISYYSSTIELTRISLQLEVLNIYPIPAKESLTLELSSPRQAPIQIILRDLQGKAVLRRKMEAGIGTESYSLSLTNLAAGVYALQVQQGAEGITRKVVVLK